MIREGMTIREAAELWVEGFNAIPYGIVEKLLKAGGYEELNEITPPAKGDRVYVYEIPGEVTTHEGEVRSYDEETELYCIELDDGKLVSADASDFEVERDGFLPMWGTLWAFGDGIDNAWVDNEYIGNGLQAMADCGFRVYEQEDYGYIFGIDGAGYDFYEAHWIPLYKARGLHWHDPATEKEGAA